MSLVPTDGKDRLQYSAWYVGPGEEMTIGSIRVSMHQDGELSIQFLASTHEENSDSVHYSFDGAIGCFLCEKNDTLVMIGVSYTRWVGYYKLLQ